MQVLGECHRLGVVHGDVKPDNIVSLKDKSGIVLLDFGSANLWDGVHTCSPLYLLHVFTFVGLETVTLIISMFWSMFGASILL